jgi:hypothetical protein
MAHAINLARRAMVDPGKFARSVIVCGCALALIAAGQALPF